MTSPEADTTGQAPNYAVLDSPLDAFRVAIGDRLNVIDTTRSSKQ